MSDKLAKVEGKAGIWIESATGEVRCGELIPGEQWVDQDTGEVKLGWVLETQKEEKRGFVMCYSEALESLGQKVLQGKTPPLSRNASTLLFYLLGDLNYGWWNCHKFSQRDLAAEFGWSVSRINSSLQELVKAGLLSIEADLDNPNRKTYCLSARYFWKGPSRERAVLLAQNN